MLKPHYSHIMFAGCKSRACGAYWSVSVTHRFLGRGKKKAVGQEGSNEEGDRCRVSLCA